MTKEKAAELVGENLKTLYAWALYRVSHKEDAEDLCADVSLAVIENAHRLRCDDAFYGWFWQVARNTYANFLKARSKNTSCDLESIAEPEDSDTPEAIAVQKESYRALYREISLLAKNHRECSVDYYFNELSVKEIAEKRGLTPESVKYYLFKTRKILKEGIAMERQFGEKSFNPAPFDFNVFYSGSITKEFLELFRKRKLPGQILSAAYYSPMRVSEICLELGVPTVYLEDEIRVLCDYGLLKKSGDKYQTQIILMDEGFFHEVWNKCEKELRGEAKIIADGLGKKLENIREIGFVGNNLDGGLILWDSFIISLTEAYQRIPAPAFSQKLCDNNTVGFCYGITCDKNSMPDIRRGADSLANTYNRADGQVVRYLLFSDNRGIKNMDTERVDFMVDALVDEYRADPANTKIPAISDEEMGKLRALISEEIDNTEKLIRLCNGVCTESLKNRAPEGIDVNEGTTLLASLMFIFSMIATLCEDEGLVYPEDKHPGIIAIR